MAALIMDTVAWIAIMAARTVVAKITGASFRLASAALQQRAAPQPPASPSPPRVLWRLESAPAPAVSVSSACSSAPGSTASAESSDAASSGSGCSATLEVSEAEASAPSEGFPGFTILSVGEQLGAGAFGKVEAVTIQMADGTVRDAVLKTLYDHLSEAAYDREVKALEAARGVPYVVQMYGACRTADRSCIVLERIHGMTLFEFLDKAFAERGSSKRPLLPHAQVAKLAYQLLSGVRDLHGLGFAHNDIKLQNVMLREGSNELCLLDLGNASWTDADGHLEYVGGSMGYMSPETSAALYRKAGRSRPTLSSDMYSCGICIACMTEYGTRTSQVRGLLDYEILPPSHFDDACADLFLGLADDTPTARYSAAEAASHPFVMRTGAS